MKTPVHCGLDCLASYRFRFPAKEATGTDMNRFNDKRLTDIVLGEAILALLSEGDPITPYSLMEKLQFMAISEKMAFRKQACTNAVVEVQSSLMAQSSEYGSVQAGSEYPPSSKMIH